MDKHEELEVAWAEANGLEADRMVACSSGTAALHLAVELCARPYSKVLVPDYTMAACARAVTLADHGVVFGDCLEKWLTLDPDELKVHNVSAVMAVHVYGRACHMDDITAEAKRSKVEVIEDLAEAHGVKPHALTDAACWSFYQNKIVGGEEGGAVWFRDVEYARYARKLRSLGFVYDSDGGHEYRHVPRGHNYRMSRSHASLVLASLKAYPINVKRRWEQLNAYREATPPEMLRPMPDAPWVHDVNLPAGKDRREVYESLKAEGLPVRYGFRPMSKQDEYRRLSGDVVNAVWERVLYVNLDPTVTALEADRRVRVVRRILSDG